MYISLSFSKKRIEGIARWLRGLRGERVVALTAVVFSAAAILVSYINDWIVTYGDSESHLNIAKRVIDSVTPGFAQLGGIWLPLPHVLMLPFVWSDFLWRSGLAGSLVSGVSFVVSAVFLYKTMFLLSKSKSAALAAAAVFLVNPNALYMQSTPMTEMLLIAFCTLSVYFFIRFLLGISQLPSIMLASLFGFCAVLTRYDGWFLVCLEALVIVLYYLPWRRLGSWSGVLEFYRSETFKKMEGFAYLFVTCAFLGILLWLVWGYLILGDPLYFTNSEFSARSQQEAWQAKGQLPAYHNLPQAVLYYSVTAMSNAGLLMFVPALVGFWLYLTDRSNPRRWLTGLVLAAPFIFNILTLFVGQSVIFIEHLTPSGFDHTTFNVRYGLMALPLLALGWGFLYLRSRTGGKLLLLFLLVAQLGLYYVGYSRVVTWYDGTAGLSSARRPDAERWIRDNYDYGMVLMDDYARTVSVVRSGVPMQNMIYIGNKPYWEESLAAPQTHARWVVMQENDSVWKSLWETPEKQGRLYKYYEKVYTSPQVLIFRRQSAPPPPDKFWDFQCVDTMKYSRDAAREFLTRSDAAAFIDREVQLAKDSGATCVSLGTPYDAEFIPILELWVTAAREKGLSIWFRGNMSGWEGWFDYPEFTSTAQHHQGIRNLVTSRPDLFRDGDIFTPAPEPENGMLGDPRSGSEARQNFTRFITESYRNCVDSFAALELGVSCGYFSYNGDVAREIMTKELIAQTGGVLAVDHYVSTPEKLVTDLKAMHEKFDVPIVLGEFGAPIPDIHGALTPAQQADFIRRALELLRQEGDMVQGINYWVLRGGSTTLVNDDGTVRPAFSALKSYYAPRLVTGQVTDMLGQPVPNARVSTSETGISVQTDSEGGYRIVIPGIDDTVRINDDSWVSTGSVSVTAGSEQVTVQDLKVDPVKKGLWYRIRLWFKNL